MERRIEGQEEKVGQSLSLCAQLIESGQKSPSAERRTWLLRPCLDEDQAEWVGHIEWQRLPFGDKPAGKDDIRADILGG